MKRLFHTTAYGDLPIKDCYWSTTTSPGAHPALTETRHTEVAIIGAGFTGLNAAIRLAERHSAETVVLDANQPAWGASGRNGGFACLGGSKLEADQLTGRYGLEKTREFVDAQARAIQLVEENLNKFSINADRHSRGEWLIAHRPDTLADLKSAADFMTRNFGIESRAFSQSELIERGMRGPEFFDGLHTNLGFGLNPRKYAGGLTTAVAKLGVDIYGESPVTALSNQSGKHVLQTPTGKVIANRVIVATNGYSSDDWHPGLHGCYLPSISNILVTRPLTNDELNAQGWWSDDMAYDSRTMLHYFRLMPNRRFLFGLRGGTVGSAADMSRSRLIARRDFDRMFPEWRQVETPYFWSGLLCLSRTLLPYAGPLDENASVWAGMAYHGNGVALGSYTGQLVADLCLGATDLRVPHLMQIPLRRFPLPGLRRHYLRPIYAWYHVKDQ